MSNSYVPPGSAQGHPAPASLDDVAAERDALAARLRALHVDHAALGRALEETRRELERASAERARLEAQLDDAHAERDAAHRDMADAIAARENADRAAVELASELAERAPSSPDDDLRARCERMSVELGQLREDLAAERARAHLATVLTDETRTLLSTLQLIDERANEQRSQALARLGSLLADPTSSSFVRRPDRRSSSASIPAPPIVHVAPLEHLTLDVSDLDE